MCSTDRRVPVENTVRALRRLAPGASLREPRDPDVRVLARALRSVEPAVLARGCPGEVARVVPADQVRALDRAAIGFFGAGPPEAARLVRASRCGAGSVTDRLRAEPGLRCAAPAWAEAMGHGVLGASLRGAPPVPAGEDGRRAAELTLAALLPRADRLPGELGAPKGEAILEVRGIRVGSSGFRVDVESGDRRPRVRVPDPGEGPGRHGPGPPLVPPAPGPGRPGVAPGVRGLPRRAAAAHPGGAGDDGGGAGEAQLTVRLGARPSGRG